MKKNIIYLSLMTLLLATIAWQSCSNDFDLEELKDRWKPAFSLPVAHASMQLSDILSDNEDVNQYLYTDDNGILHIRYKDTLLNLNAASFLPIINQDFNQNYVITHSNETSFDAMPTNNKLEILNKNFPYNFNTGTTGNKKVDKIYIKKGTLVISVKPNLTQAIDAEIIVTIASLTNSNNEEFSFTMTGKNEIYTSEELDGYLLTLKNDEFGNNGLDIFYNVNFIKKSGEKLYAGDDIDLQVFIKDVEFEKIEGNFGNTPIQQQQQIDLNMGELVSDGELFIKPDIKFLTNSNLGLPLDIKITQFDAITEKENGHINIVKVNLPSSLSPIHFEGVNNVGDSILQTFDITDDATYPDLFDAIGKFPKFLNITALCIPNPEINNADVKNFFINDSKIGVNIDIDLPLSLAAKFKIRDTMEMDFSDIDDNLDKLDSLHLKLEIKNQFPINFDFQVYLLEETEPNSLDYETIDSLFLENMQVYPENQSSTITIAFQNNRVDNLKKTKKAIFVGYVKTSDFEQLNSEGEHIFKDFLEEHSINFNLSTDVWLAPAKEKE